MTTSNDTLFVPKVTTITSAIMQSVNDLTWKGRDPNYATTTGSANAQVLTLASPSLYSSYVAGDSFHFTAGYSNTAACTLQVIGSTTLAATSIYANGVAITSAGALIAGNVYTAVFDGTYFQIRESSNLTFGYGQVSTCVQSTYAFGVTYTNSGTRPQVWEFFPNPTSGSGTVQINYKGSPFGPLFTAVNGYLATGVLIVEPGASFSLTTSTGSWPATYTVYIFS